MNLFTVGILTVSDRAFKGEREDLSGKEIALTISGVEGFHVAKQDIVPDEEEEISRKLLEFVDQLRLDLIITTGGTGLSPRDRTPEATRAVIHQEIPGMAEAMRAQGLKSTPHAMLSRGIAGRRNLSLIVNLPGNPRAARENLMAILPALSHALFKIKGDPSECGP